MKTRILKGAALGIRMHSGWGVLVAVSADANLLELLDRRRIVTMDPAMPGAKQPYHHAVSLGLPESVQYLAKCAAASKRLALTAVREVARELDGRHYLIVGAAVLLASGRPLPPLPEILASRPLLHTAEGEFFRNAARSACECLKISVRAIRERDLDEQANLAFGNGATHVRRRISSLRISLGPPWTTDHRTAALAASVVLANEKLFTSSLPERVDESFHGSRSRG